jgi:hypothetical protein
MINEQRKIQLINYCRGIFNEIPPMVTGNNSLGALVGNRIQRIAKDTDEFQYCIDVIGEIIARIGKNPEVSNLKCSVCSLDFNHCICDWAVPDCEVDENGKIRIKKPRS